MSSKAGKRAPQAIDVRGLLNIQAMTATKSIITMDVQPDDAEQKL